MLHFPLNADATPSQATSWVSLADLLGSSRRALYSWRKLPGAPAIPDLEAWENFIEDHGLGFGRKPGKEREALLTDRVKLQNRILALKAEKDERSVVGRAEVTAGLDRVIDQAKAFLHEKLEVEFPSRAAGKSTAELASLGRAIADEIAAGLQAGFPIPP